MPLTPENYSGREDYSRFGASVAGILEAHLRVPPHKRTLLSTARMIDQLLDAAYASGIDIPH